MKSKYLVPFLTVIFTGFSICTEKAIADVVVEWQPGDNFDNIQQAIDSGDSLVIISQAEQPWIISKTLIANTPNQTIRFESGVVLEAQPGQFQGRSDQLVRIEADNVTLSGYDATFKMQKDDYANPNLYEPSQFRHAIVARGALNFTIEGLTIIDSGGDAILVTNGRKSESGTIPEKRFSSGTVRDVVADNNYRQGISVVSAQNLVVENSIFKNTSGVRPSAGVDLEPDFPWQKLVNINFNNNQFLNNDRHGIQIGLGKYRGEGVTDVSINFDGCISTDNGLNGIRLQGIRAGFYNGPQGLISFKDCEIEGSGEHGIWIRNDQLDPSATFQVKFENTKVIDSAIKTGEFYPVTLWNTIDPGGITNIDFGDDFVIRDNKKRPGVFANGPGKKDGFTNISGIVNIENPKQKPSRLGKNLTNVTVKFTN